MSDRPRLPLTGLQVFEAAARHDSFPRTAEELAITLGAVSRQITALEADLAVRLFERFNRAVRLTETGRRLAVFVGQGIARMEEAVQEVGNPPQAVLAVTAMHSFAARWLAPHLHLFNDRHPDIQVLVAASDAAVDLFRDRYDLAIRFGRGPYPGFAAKRRFSIFVFPVCTPRLLEQTPLNQRSRQGPADRRCEPRPDRARLGRVAGAGRCARGGVARRAAVPNTHLSIEAALAGRGVALAEAALAQDELAPGRLINPSISNFRALTASGF